jgi:hypothetical protein
LKHKKEASMPDDSGGASSLRIIFMKLRFTGLLVFVSLAAAYANAPLPDSSYLGITRPIAVGGQINNINPSGGGAFNGYISNGTTSWATTFWCIDSQLYFSPQNLNPLTFPSRANVIRLDQIPANSAFVRYSGVTNAGNPQWRNNNNTDNAQPAWYSSAHQTLYDLLPSAAQDRYRMAAWLVSQYNPGNNQAGLIAGSPDTIKIQKTIWALINNTTPGLDAVGHQTFANTGDWLKKALDNYRGVDLTRWAVVSWQVGPNGSLTVPGSLDYRQTFLVQVVPEPGFYGLLALGLAGLGVIAQRRRLQDRV